MAAVVAAVDSSLVIIADRNFPKLAQMAAISSMSDIHFVPFVFCSSGAGVRCCDVCCNGGWLSAVREMQDLDDRCWILDAHSWDSPTIWV